MAVINTNITSLIGQNNLNKSQNDLSTSMERLSSGLRINSAKDDAAGQAIANRMTSQVTGLSQASRNANDGISLSQTAEGALDQINDNLQRVRELTVQAQNGTNSASDIDSIQQEVNERLDEINRVTSQTQFNGIDVLSGNGKSFSIQVGAQDDQTISITMNDSAGWNLSALGTTAAGTLDQVKGEQRSVDVKGFDVLSKNDNTTTLDATKITDIEGDADTADNTFVTASLVSYSDTSGKTSYAVVDTGTGATGDAVSVTFDSDGNAVIGEKLTGANKFLAEDDDSYTVVADGASVNISGNSNALDTLDAALKSVDEQRSSLGAIQNRFESAIDNISTTSTNLSAAKSRIEDADYAVEVSNMTRAQILQQAGTSVLAQANQVPQGVLSLLQ